MIPTINMKFQHQASQPPPAIYRDEPDYAETASMSSAVLLDEVDFPDEQDLPSYEETQSSQSGGATPAVTHAPLEEENERVPELPFSSHDFYLSEYRTLLPLYSENANALYSMIKNQARYPPAYLVEIQGTHSETRRNNNKETKDTVVDFLFSIDLTRLLGKPATGEVELLPDNQRGYRGTRIPSLKPTVSDQLDDEAGRMDELKSWCEKYVADPRKVKSFVLQRKIINHDKKKLEQLLRSAIAETNYRGHVSVTFRSLQNSLVVYSPSKINAWRSKNWLRWVFYCTFLWIFAWPVLFFVTARYSVVQVVWSYANSPNSNNPSRRATVMSEAEWFQSWQSAVKRAALARMQCRDMTLDEEYRHATEQADRRGEIYAAQPQILSTGNVFGGGAFQILGQGLRIAEQFNNRAGWGGDC